MKRNPNKKPIFEQIKSNITEGHPAWNNRTALMKKCKLSEHEFKKAAECLIYNKKILIFSGTFEIND